MAGRSPRINTQIADYSADRKIFGERSLQILHGFFYLLSRLELLNCSFLIYFELGKIVETSKKTLFRSLRTYSNGNIKHENLKLVTISSPPFRLHLRSFPPRIPTLIWLASPPSKATREHVAIIKQIHHPLRREILPASSNIFEPQFIASRLFRTGSWVGTHVYTPSCTHTRNRGWWARARMTHPPVWPVGFRLIRWLTGCTRPDLTGLHRCNTRVHIRKCTFDIIFLRFELHPSVSRLLRGDLIANRFRDGAPMTFGQPPRTCVQRYIRGVTFQRVGQRLG